VERLITILRAALPSGVPLFPRDMVTDRSEQFLVSEMVREKIYAATRQEIPYCARVEIEGWENPDEERRFPTIRAVIHVDSNSRKGILIGKGGEMLKRIGTAAREEIEKHLGTKVVLKLHVDVEQEWKNNPSLLNQYLELGS
jgi:GTP-binding protein Era